MKTGPEKNKMIYSIVINTLKGAILVHFADNTNLLLKLDVKDQMKTEGDFTRQVCRRGQSNIWEYIYIILILRLSTHFVTGKSR